MKSLYLRNNGLIMELLLKIAALIKKKMIDRRDFLVVGPVYLASKKQLYLF